MQGKYITTILKLAVLAGSRQQKQTEVKETMAQTSSHRLIWSKELSTAKAISAAPAEEMEMA